MSSSSSVIRAPTQQRRVRHFLSRACLTKRAPPHRAPWPTPSAEPARGHPVWRVPVPNHATFQAGQAMPQHPTAFTTAPARTIDIVRCFASTLFAAIAVLVSAAAAEPISPNAIRVVDGDTIRAHGSSVRLVGFDTPERGSLAKCEGERILAARATERLRELVSAGPVDLQIVDCACRPGTEGTRRCNGGRACGVMAVNGRNVGDVLISEGLARPYVCDGPRCPRRGSWCGTSGPPGKGAQHRSRPSRQWLRIRIDLPPLPTRVR